MSEIAQQFHVDESRPWFSEEAGWPQEVPRNLDFPEMTLGEMLRTSASKWPDHKALWFLDTFMTYRRLDDLDDRLAAGLYGIGLRKGDVVAALLPNSFQYVITYFACARLGCVVSGVNPTYKSAEILHQLKVTGARALVVLDALYEPAVAPIIEASGIKQVIATNIADLADLSFPKRFLGKLLNKIPTGPVPPHAVSFMKLLRSAPTPPKVEQSAHDPATYIMTGGTTGVPKAAVLSHFNCVSNALQCKTWIYKIEPGAANLCVLPLFHSFAMTAVMNTSLICGAWVMLFPRPPKTEDLIAKVTQVCPDGRTMYPGAEVLFQKLAEHPGIEHTGIAKKFALCVSGAGPLHRPVQEAFEAKTGARLVEGYGLTEATPVVCAGPFWGNRKIGTIGLPFPGTEWVLMDPNRFGVVREPCPDGQEPDQELHTGELCVAGPQVMVGYLDQPAETADHIKEWNGKKWLLTGDVGFMDPQGRVMLRDRKKQLIKYKGYSVFPKEVEELVGNHPAVLEVAAAGLPDRETGEKIKAWVVLRPEHRSRVTTEELLAWCRQNMTHYKVPSYLEFIDELPKNLIGKVQRRLLQEADPLYRPPQPPQG
ncbi:MAG: AMP-binding protein [Myxococcota bacterium]|jgi:long-chain acyl-CoA synthetase|nr:AMP-binding protein [Myxococcota bacterium]